MIFKKMIALIIVFAMAAAFVPGSVFAVETETASQESGESESFDETGAHSDMESFTETEIQIEPDTPESETEISDFSNMIVSFKDPGDIYVRTADSDLIMDSLPKTVLAGFADGSEGEIPAEWEVVDAVQDGDDLYLSLALLILEDYPVADEVELPIIEAVGLGFYSTSANSTAGSRADVVKVGTGTITAETGDDLTIYYGSSSNPNGYHKIFVTYNGKKYVAYCIESDKDNPKGTDSSVYRLENAYSTTANKRILKALYYGYTSNENLSTSRFITSGLAKIVEDNLSASDVLYDWNNNDGETVRKDRVYHFLTHAMLAKLWGYSEWNHDMTFNEIAVVNKLITKLDSLDMPADPTIQIVANDTGKEEIITAYVGKSDGDSNKEVQRTKDLLVSGDPSNSVTLNLPANVTAYIGDTTKSGNVKISGGQVFHLEAPLSMTGIYSQTGIKGAITSRVVPYVTFGGSNTVSSGYQDLMFLFSETVGDSTYIKVNWLEHGYLQLLKSSDEISITDGNECYSLAGAEYTVYKTNNNGVLSNPVTTLTTDENGDTGTVELYPDIYYVKETTPAEGYYLDDTIYAVKVTCEDTADHPVLLSVSDVPGNAPTGIEITKLINGEETEQCLSLVGAQFTVKYYDGYYTQSSLPANADRTWVLQTIEADGAYIANFSDECKVAGDEFYYMGDMPTIPLGTITVQETQSAPGYTLNGYIMDKEGNRVSVDSAVYLTQITKKGEVVSIKGGNEYLAYDTPVYGTVRIVKYDTDGNTPLAGVTFALKKMDGTLIAERTTGTDGTVLFEDLYPDRYLLTEISTVSGHTLLADPLEITVPMEFTELEINDRSIDKAKCIYNEFEDVYYIYDFTYEITNGAALILPMTGCTDSIQTYIPFVFAFAMFAGVGCCFMKKKNII